MPKAGQVTRHEEPVPDLVQIFTISERVNQMLLAGLDENAWRAQPLLAKGRSIAEAFVHIHNVRVMWIQSGAKGSANPTKLDKSLCTRDQVQIALVESANCIRAMLSESLSKPGASISGFRPNAAHFVAYLITHEAHHRGKPGSRCRRSSTSACGNGELFGANAVLLSCLDYFI